ncbi:hypothetical protein H8356DRAFT_358801 [Neocallimastix lanati (nom. inval.)]|jgi:protein pelota|uniref:Protein DOM34 homolog n=1 Tax=Neocallimastix californiae TaxID=1754190 RepID=A0A1Y2AC27_9FUNG|nr:hypothetical protein H8356DRAFT_358801 [Neocallimastix sp. JGI-2020a]ORY20052.1 hypothetical protein LY90DRAFT_434675 [Neocallimastix californiae]|eukprot:ORY20052.1 hypothetical protein LY90DRAFT_434675 [Neocallimastix californiae]
MKLLEENIEKDKSGFVTLLLNEPEDMWHIYNLIQKGDQLKASTVRQIVIESSTGSTSKSMVHLTLTIAVKKTHFDVQLSQLRVSGRNISKNNHVRIGAHHTIDLFINSTLTLIKEEWDVISLERIKEACDITKTADVAAVVLQEGLANICLITYTMTIVRQRIEVNIQKKRKGFANGYEDSLKKFYQKVIDAIIHHVNFDIVKVLIIASPGFVKDDLYTYMMNEEIKVLLENKSKILLIHCSSGHKHSLNEVLKEPGVRNLLSLTKYKTEIKALQRFYDMLDKDSERAFYGIKSIIFACENNAIETLLLSDKLFRSNDIETRKKYIKLVEDVRAKGGKVLIYSSLHNSGEQLNQLTGVAAILNFPLKEPNSDEDKESSEKDDDDESVEWSTSSSDESSEDNF